MTVSTVIPSHQVALWLLTHVDRILDRLGLEHEPSLEEAVYVVIVVLIALFIGWVIRRLILWAARRLVAWRQSTITAKLLKDRVLAKCSHIIPPLVITALIPFAFDSSSSLLHVFKIALYLYTIVTFVIAITVINRFIWERFDERENTKNLPLKGILNVCNGLVWIIAAIVMGSVVLDKSPVALLTGLGAFAAALMLIFKDSILGFVAGIQLSGNDMLRVGDWIVVPSTIANGIVIDVSLTVVKVRNWDNTIVTLPPYTLISSSFQNYRGMQESGWRLISKTILIDTDSVVTTTPEILAAASQLPGMKEYIDKIQKDGQIYDPGVAVVNGTIDTNLGLLRAYMCYYLMHHPLIGTDQQILVNITGPEADGLPLQIYCYTTTAWTAYEAVKSEIFEHLAVTAPKLGVRLFNNPSGNDVTSISVVSAPAGANAQPA